VHDAAEVRRAAPIAFARTPGTGGGFYGEGAVRELETQDVQEMCRAGLARVKSLEAQDDAFIQWLKRRAIEGFYTSQAGLKELDYKGNSFYSVSPGCPPDAQP